MGGNPPIRITPFISHGKAVFAKPADILGGSYPKNPRDRPSPGFPRTRKPRPRLHEPCQAASDAFELPPQLLPIDLGERLGLGHCVTLAHQRLDRHADGRLRSLPPCLALSVWPKPGQLGCWEQSTRLCGCVWPWGAWFIPQRSGGFLQTPAGSPWFALSAWARQAFIEKRSGLWVISASAYGFLSSE